MKCLHQMQLMPQILAKTNSMLPSLKQSIVQQQNVITKLRAQKDIIKLQIESSEKTLKDANSKPYFPLTSRDMAFMPYSSIYAQKEFRSSPVN